MEVGFKHIELDTVETNGLNQAYSINFRSSEGYTYLSFAVRKGSIKSVNYILTRGADINYRETGGATPLMLAIHLGRYDVVLLLIRNRADFKLRDSYETPLTLAVRENHLDIVKCLVENGADVEDTNIKGFSPLFLSIKKSRVNILDFFLHKGFDKGKVDTANNSPLIAAIRNNSSLDVIRCFIKYKTDLNESRNERTPLAWASAMGNLLSHEADINLLSENGNTALATAVQCKQNEVVKYLISRDCNVCKVGKNGKTPLLWAVLNENVNAIKILLENGAQYIISTVFCDAIKTKNMEIVNMLYEREKLINPTGKIDCLLTASRCKSAEIAGHLLENDTKVDDGLLDVDEDTKLCVLEALKQNDTKIVKFLIEKGMKVNDFETCTHTLLTISVELEDLEMVKYFVSQGADVNQADGRGLTPLAVASLNDDFRILQYLVDSGATISEEDKTKDPKLANYYKMLKEKSAKRGDIRSNQEEGGTADA